MMNMTMDQAQKAMDIRDAYIRLRETKDYQLVFEEAYFKDEAMRLALAVVDINMQEDIEQRLISEQIRAVGHLHVFLNSKINLGNIVEESLANEEKERVDAAKNIQYDEITGDQIVEEEI